MARCDVAGVRLLTRNGLAWTQRYPGIAAAVGELRCRSCLLEGEVVICGEDGIPVFDRLRYGRQVKVRRCSMPSTCSSSTGGIYGARRSRVRKAMLAKLLQKAPGRLQLNEHIEEAGDVVFRHACKLGFEGIVSKRLGSPYISTWLKCKNPAAPAVKREAEEDWGRGKWR